MHKLKVMEKGIREGFSKVKNELDEHLDSINQNTAEFDNVNQRITVLEGMLDKLTERIDELVASKQPNSYTDFNVPLTLREQEVFVVLYTSSSSLSAVNVARQLGLTDELVHTYIYKLISKGIPIMKTYKEKELFYSLEKTFKDLQARKSLIHIDSGVLEQFSLQRE